MKRVFVAALTISYLLILPSITTADERRTVISFRTMYGVDGPFRGSANAIRGFPETIWPGPSPIPRRAS